MRKNTRATSETSPQNPRTQLKHSIKNSSATGFLSLHRARFSSTAQCQAAFKFCKAGWCPFYKNSNVQYITLCNLNLYSFVPIGGTHQFVQARREKKKEKRITLLWLFPPGIIVNRVNQNLVWWGSSMRASVQYPSTADNNRQLLPSDTE